MQNFFRKYGRWICVLLVLAVFILPFRYFCANYMFTQVGMEVWRLKNHVDKRGGHIYQSKLSSFIHYKCTAMDGAGNFGYGYGVDTQNSFVFYGKTQMEHSYTLGNTRYNETYSVEFEMRFQWGEFGADDCTAEVYFCNSPYTSWRKAHVELSGYAETQSGNRVILSFDNSSVYYNTIQDMSDDYLEARASLLAKDVLKTAVSYFEANGLPELRKRDLYNPF